MCGKPNRDYSKKRMDLFVNQTSYSCRRQVTVWSSGNQMIILPITPEGRKKFQPVCISGNTSQLLTVDSSLFIWNEWILLLYYNSEFNVSYALCWYQCPCVLVFTDVLGASLAFLYLLQSHQVELPLENSAFLKYLVRGKKKKSEETD